MISKLLLASAAVALSTSALTPVASATQAADHTNPLLTQSTLPYHAPRFDRIEDSDYLPAIEQGMKQHLAEIETIAGNPAAPTFDNTIVAMEKSGQLLDRATATFFNIVSANSNDALQKVQSTIAPELAAHQDAIYLNDKLFQRVQQLYQNRDTLNLNDEQEQLLEVYHENFVLAGAQLSAADKAKLKDLNKEISTLETRFQQKLLAGTKESALVIDDKAQLAGLSETQIANARQAAEERGMPGKWVLPLQNTTQQPLLQSLDNRDTRKALFENSWLRTSHGGENDTRDTISQLAQLRADKAKLLGFPNYSAFVLADQMAKTPEAVDRFMAQLVPATAAQERREAADIQKMIESSGKDFKLKPWDWQKYAEKVRKARYDLDEDQVKPYFELNKVLKDGVFYAANKLYGLTFKERTDIPVYHPDVRVFEVFDSDGTKQGLIYFDYFKRDNKSGGAWMSNFVGQSKLMGTKPVIYNVANFQKPAEGQPALISFDDVTTMFHEFGHALHGLFADQTYPTLSGTNVARDFVEFPSQFNEHWALEPDVLKHYAVNYKTGEVIPDALVAKIKKAATFNQGYALGELLAAAKLDLAWHDLPAGAPKQDVDTFEAKTLASMGLDIKDVPPRYRSSYFLHIWSNGYASGYYAYLWTEMLEEDAYKWFENHGGMTRENGQRFRDMILSRGHTMDYGPMFRAFYGKDPQIGPMLESRGLTPVAEGGDTPPTADSPAEAPAGAPIDH
ncbi:peptidyl-dipeptidase Dcp [Stakelama saccharophila]|uniref:Peptidyl-dipeptidase Dcp n=1 Tax=Stakelama saccharophila TaxID=3075605 RepID=A0ABZ0B952_9SPHN|nr:peptidyl-dipeptidase Dcp [Stakelama sp. W311]WNO53808.1 peptidyl-dipeptidase Dcp [Stakelama sp. W311]